MKITMDIVIDSEEFQTDQSFMDIQSSMMSALSNESSNGSFEITLGDNITLKATDLTAERVAFKCSNNTFPSYTTSSCGKSIIDVFSNVLIAVSRHVELRNVCDGVKSMTRF